MPVVIRVSKCTNGYNFKMGAKSRTLRVHANANVKPKKVKRKRVLKLHITQDQGVQVAIPDSRVPDADLSLGKNMAALDLAVSSRKPAALVLQELLAADSRYLDERIKFMFRGVQGDTRQHVQCTHCKARLGHQCLHEGKLTERQLNIQHFMLG